MVFLLLAHRLAGWPASRCGLVVCPHGLYKSRLSRAALGMPFLLDLSGPQITGCHGNWEGLERKSNLTLQMRHRPCGKLAAWISYQQ